MKLRYTKYAKRFHIGFDLTYWRLYVGLGSDEWRNPSVYALIGPLYLCLFYGRIRRHEWWLSSYCDGEVKYISPEGFFEADISFAALVPNPVWEDGIDQLDLVPPTLSTDTILKYTAPYRFLSDEENLPPGTRLAN